ncbi:MAG TPA: PAS domain-containing protein [Methylophilaceae bacterium]|nr:PAS domain-containing protein [Methylophilaceae bacterium]
MILGSWYDIQGPFLSHVVMLVSSAVTIFSAAIIIAAQPLFFSRTTRSRREYPQSVAWSKEVSTALTSPAAVLDNHIVRFVNTPFLQALGMVGMTDQVVGMPFTNLIHPADHQIFAELIAETALFKNTHEATRIRLVCADGTTLPAHVSPTRMREDVQNNLMLLQFTPISDLSPLSDDYGQFNYHSIVDRLEEIIFQLGVDGRMIFLNPAWEHMLDYKVQDSLHQPLADFFHPEDKPALEAKLDSLIQGKRSHCLTEARLISKNGEPHWVMLRAKTTSPSKSERSSVIGTLTDIKRNKDAEASLHANRRALNTLLSNIPGMVYRGRVDRSWSFEFVSEGCIDVTGYDPLDLINDSNVTYNLIIHPEDRAAVWGAVNQQLSANKEFKLIYRIISRNGDVKLVQEHGRGIYSSTGELLALEGFITEIPNQRFNVSASATA